MIKLRLKKSFSIFIVPMMFASAACSKKIDTANNLSTVNQLPPGVSMSPSDSRTLQYSIERGEAVTLSVLIEPKNYATSLKLLQDYQDKGLLEILLNPNESKVEIDAAPFMVIKFQSEFFAEVTPDDLFGKLGIASIAFNRMHAVPKALTASKTLEIGSANMPVNAMKARELGVQGAGVKVAVIDTGFDVNHPMLQSTPSGKDKIIDFQDFTNEGHFDLRQVTDASDLTVIKAKFQSAAKASELSKSVIDSLQEATYFSATILERRAVDASIIEFDIDGDSKSLSHYEGFVAKVDSKTSLIALDTDGDGQFGKNEMLLQASQVESQGIGTSISKQIIPFGSGLKKGIRNVFVRFDEKHSLKGPVLTLGFDQIGHGSHVSGIIAGNLMTEKGAYQGVAPEAQIMALKVCSGEGCSEQAIVSAMIYAAKHGANIVNMSLGGPESIGANAVSPRILHYLTQKYGTLFVISAGNSGPALDTGGDPGNYGSALTVGAFNPAESQEANYGLSSTPGLMFWWSSRGPTFSGAPKPDVVAPGGALSSIPKALGMNFDMWNGTSMSAPMVAGLAALVFEKTKDLEILQSDVRKSLSQRPLALKRALEEGAVPLTNYEIFDQGYGLVNGVNSVEQLMKWNTIFKERAVKDASFKLFHDLNIKGNFFSKNGSSNRQNQKVELSEFLDLSRLSGDEVLDPEAGLDVYSRAPWIRLQNVYGDDKGDVIKKIQPFTRNNGFSFDIEKMSDKNLGSVRAGFIEIMDSQSGIPQGRILVTDIQPMSLDPSITLLEDGVTEGSYRNNLGTVTLKAGQSKRLFVLAPKNMTGLGVITKAVNDNGALKNARLIVTISGPAGKIAEDTENIHIRGGKVFKEKATTVAQVSKSGIYEVVLTCPASMPESTFTLELRGSGMRAQPLALATNGAVDLSAMDQLRDSAFPIRAMALPWMSFTKIPFVNSSAKEFTPSLNFGSTIYLKTEVQGAVKFIASGENDSTLYTTEILDENRNPLTEDEDYELTPLGFQIFAKKRMVTVAVHAAFVGKQTDTVSLTLIKQVAEAPKISVGKAVEGITKAHLSSIADYNVAALTLVLWSDDYLGTSPIARTAVANIVSEAERSTEAEPLRVSAKELEQTQLLLKAFGPLLKEMPDTTGDLN